MIQLSGSHAVGMIANTINTPRCLTEVVHPNVEKWLAAADRSRDSFEIRAFKVCAVKKDASAARPPRDCLLLGSPLLRHG